MKFASITYPSGKRWGDVREPSPLAPHCVDLSRNFGKEIALSAGLQHASGDAVVTMDADLQHPPELIPEFLAHWREGYKMVYAARQSATRETWLHTLFAKVFYWVFARISHLDLPKGAGDFRLLDRRVVNALNAMPERTRFMKGLFAWVGFSQIGVPFVPPERFSGKSGFILIASGTLPSMASPPSAPYRCASGHCSAYSYRRSLWLMASSW